MVYDIQEEHLARIKKTIYESVESHEVAKGAVSVSTPFIDWDGSPVEVYVTKDGQVTDGGGTMSLLQSLNMKEDFDSWPFLQDYLTRYCIDFDGRRMNLRNLGNDLCYLRYIQGISRLPSYFEPKPVIEMADTFPQTVRNSIMGALRSQYQDNVAKGLEIAEVLIRERKIPLRKRKFKISSDLSPFRRNRVVQIVSYANATAREQEQHVAYKVLAPIVWKQENMKIDAYAVVHDIKRYTSDSVDMLEEATDDIIQLKDEDGTNRLMSVLTES